MMALRAIVLALLILSTPLLAAAQSRIAVLTEPGTPVVATELLLTVGPIDEDEEKAGLAYLAVRTVMAPVRTVLDSLGAHMSVMPQKDALSVSVIASPEVWEEASRTLVTALFREEPDNAAMIDERRAIVSELRGRAANPADAATLETDRAFFGADHPWGRSTVGSPQSVERLSFRDVEEFLQANVTPDRAFVAVVGPIDAETATGHLRPLLGSTFPAAIEVIPFHPAERPIRRDYNSITTWVSASFRFPETGDEDALRFVAYLASEALSFTPSQRSVYNVWSEVIPRIGGGEIRLQVVIPPQEADDWAERVERVVSALFEEPMLDDVFQSHLRRYNGIRIMEMLTPESRAHMAARRLLVSSRSTTLVPDLAGMTQERVRAAAEALGRPTIVLLGPDLDES